MTSQEKKLFNELSRNPYKIRKRKNLSESLILALIEDKANSIRYFTDETPEMQMKMFEILLKEISFISPSFISEYKNPCDELKIALAKYSENALQYIESPSYELQLEAVNNFGSAIQYIENPPLEMQYQAVRNDGEALQFIKNPLYDMQIDAIKQNGAAIQYIENQNLFLQRLAVTYDITCYKYIKNPSDEITRFVVETLYEISNSMRFEFYAELLPVELIDKFLQYEAEQDGCS